LLSFIWAWFTDEVFAVSSSSPLEDLVVTDKNFPRLQDFFPGLETVVICLCKFTPFRFSVSLNSSYTDCSPPVLTQEHFPSCEFLAWWPVRAVRSCPWRFFFFSWL
jgi:hypothetical protein